MKYTEVTVPGIYAFFCSDDETVDWLRKFNGINWFRGHGDASKASQQSTIASKTQLNEWLVRYARVELVADVNGEPWTSQSASIQIQLDLF